MLESLYIQNYAIIDELELSFNKGLTVITGETGAGKSIILGALSLLLGDRADSSVLINKDKKCIVEGTFEKVNNEIIQTIFEEESLDVDDKIIIRREINSNGKSRAFVNDTPTTLMVLNRLGEQLVDMHRQFDIAQLTENSFQFSVIDAFSGHQNLVEEYKKKFLFYSKEIKKIELLKKEINQANAEAEYNQYLLEELSNANFTIDEIEHLEEELKTIQHQEEIQKNIFNSREILANQDYNIIDNTKSVIASLNAIVNFKKEINPLIERLNTALEEIKDINSELGGLNIEHYLDRNPEEIEERLSMGFKLMKKHSVTTTAALLEFQEQLSIKLQSLNQRQDDIEEKEKEISKLNIELNNIATQLSNNRKKSIPQLSKELQSLLKKVDLINAQIKIEIESIDNYNAYGLNNISFLLDSNNTGNFQPLYKTASGGELSRIMLSIKSIIAEYLKVPTLIYDEVDSAISGEAIKQVSLLIKSLSKDNQVIVITHQPQMAAKGDHHYYIYKEADESGAIKTKIKSIADNERKEYIAQMIDGHNPSQATLQTVAEMMGR